MTWGLLTQSEGLPSQARPGGPALRPRLKALSVVRLEPPDLSLSASSAERWTAGRKAGTFELYNLARDPGEKENVGDANPELRAKIEALLRTARSPSEAFPLKGVDPASG